MGERLHNCATRADRLAALILLKLHAFSFRRQRQFFNNKKPGAIFARAFCTALKYDALYTNDVTAVY
jgi:hypothetical protein